jgi:hypothetical protein
MPDTNLCLRETLKAYINIKSKELNERWIIHRKEFDSENKIETEDKDLEKVRKYTFKILTKITF